MRRLTVTAPDGARLYASRGGGDGRRGIVVIHGGPGIGGAVLEEGLAFLHEHHRVIFYDQRGGGRSELTPAERTTFAHHVTDLEAVREAFGLERITLVAHSFGPLVAAAHAIAHPERVERMVFLAPLPPREGELWPRLWRLTEARLSPDEVEELRAAQQTLAGGDLAVIRRFWFLGLRPRVVDSTLIPPLVDQLTAGSVEALIHGLTVTHPATMRSLGRWDFRPRLGTVRAPTLVFHGTEDTIPLDLVAEWGTSLPTCEVVPVQGAGHFPHVEQADVVLPRLAAFVAPVR